MDKVSIAQKKFLMDTRRHKRQVILVRILILIGIVAAWEITADVGILNDFIFSSPSRMISCFLRMAYDGSIFYHMAVTIGETFVSFFFVVFLGLLMAVLLWMNSRVSEVLEPYLVILNSLPKSALAPLMIVWLGNNQKTVIVCGVLVAVFGSILTLTTGFRGVDTDKIKLIYTLGGGKWDVLRRVLIPSAIPIIISTMKVNVGLCLVGIIIGEFLATDAGLGYLIIYSTQVFEMDAVLLSIVLLCVMAMGLYQLIQCLERRYFVSAVTVNRL